MTLHHARAELASDLPAGLLDRFAAEIADHADPLDRTPDSLHAVFPGASVRLSESDGALVASVEAVNAPQLQQMREAFLYILDNIAPGLSPAVRWSGEVQRNTAPANLHLASVVSVTWAGHRFLRVRLACERVETLMVGGMHFTLLLPPPGQTPAWPMLDDQGRTRWPEGPAALHRAVYTFVALDPEAGTIDFDLFEHDGSPTTDWARRARSGEKVAIMGPGGGDFPQGRFLMIGGDETALPAIRRILETSDSRREGVALIECASAESATDLVRPDGISLDWVVRGQGPSLTQRMRSLALPDPDCFVWFAGEQAEARAMKSAFQARGLARQRGYFAGYWTAG